MEAGAAAGPAGGAAAGGDAPAGGQQPGDAAQQAQQPDLGALLTEGLSPVQDTLEEMRQFMASQAQPPAADAQQPAAAAEPDFSYLNPDAPGYNPEKAAEQLLTVLGQQNQTALQDALKPLQEQLTQTQQQLVDARTETEARALAEEFPDLQEQQVSDKVFAAAQQWVSAAGLPPEAAGNMQVIRAVYMMGRAAELSNEEGSQQQPGSATLEGAGGASPGAPAGGLTADSIVGAGSRSVLPFG